MYKYNSIYNTSCQLPIRNRWRRGGVLRVHARTFWFFKGHLEKKKKKTTAEKRSAKRARNKWCSRHSSRRRISGGSGSLVQDAWTRRRQNGHDRRPPCVRVHSTRKHTDTQMYKYTRKHRNKTNPRARAMHRWQPVVQQTA